MKDGKGARTLNFSVDIVIEPDDKMFHAFTPALQGIHVEAETEGDVIRYAVEAVQAYLEALIAREGAIPLRVTTESAGYSEGDHQGVHMHSQRVALPYGSYKWYLAPRAFQVPNGSDAQALAHPR